MRVTSRQILHMTLPVLLAVAHCVASASGPVGADELVGTWYARPQFAGATGHVSLVIRRNDEGAMTATASLLDIGARDIPLGAVSVDGEDLNAGPLQLHYRRVDETLVGTLPAAVVPVHEIPVAFERVDEIDYVPTGTPESPEAEPSWAYRTGGPVWAGLSAAADKVLVGSDDHSVYALSAARGELLWQYQTGGAIRARPTVHGESVLIHSDDGALYRVGLDDGSLAWKAVLREAPADRPRPGESGYRYDHYASAATVSGDAVFIGSGHAVHALDLDSGEPLWQFEADDLVTATPAADDDRVIGTSFDGRVFALNADDGSMIWEFDTGAAVPSSPVIVDGRIIIGSRSYDLFALRSATGKPAWQTYFWFTWIESTATIRDGAAYVGSSDAQLLTALDVSDGRRIWQFDTGGSAWARPAVGGDSVFIGAVGVADYIVAHDGGFFAVDRKTGRGKWRFSRERPDGAGMWGFAASPAILGDRVFVAALDGTVYAFPVAL